MILADYSLFCSLQSSKNLGSISIQVSQIIKIKLFWMHSLCASSYSLDILWVLHIKSKHALCLWSNHKKNLRFGHSLITNRNETQRIAHSQNSIVFFNYVCLKNSIFFFERIDHRLCNASSIQHTNHIAGHVSNNQWCSTSIFYLCSFKCFLYNLKSTILTLNVVLILSSIGTLLSL